MKNWLREKVQQAAPKPPTIHEEEEGEASGTAAQRFEGWALQMPYLENPGVPPSPN
jgi:hypothetical protein